MARTFLRPALAAALAIAPLLMSSGCRQKPTGTTRVLVIGDQPQMRDAAAAPLGKSDEVLLANVAEGLVRFDASGQIVPGLAERWNVSDDGLSYIFRVATTSWPGGKKVTAPQVARILKRLMESPDNPLRDTLGAVDDVVAMTDRVIEIQLRSPRPNLLALLAQPELAISRGGIGTGPFMVSTERGPGGEWKLFRDQAGEDEDAARREEVLLAGSEARQAIRAFGSGKADVVLGGSFADLPFAQADRAAVRALRFDPASGLFGLVPVRAGPIVVDVEVRRLLSQAIDRGALVDSLKVPGLAARATVLEPGLDGLPNAPQPPWFASAVGDRRAALAGAAARLLKSGADKPTLRVLLPDGPGSEILLGRLAADWGVLGIAVEKAASRRDADLALVDEVAPSPSAAWFLRRFRCGLVAVCDSAADTLLDSAREAPVPAQRYALLQQAASIIDTDQLFIPLAAPVRWSLVDDRVTGFAGNRYARHTLIDLQQRLTPEGS